MPGVKVAKISYSIVHANVLDYQAIADVSSAPFTTDVDLSSRASGDYWVKATVTSAAGNFYEAYAVPLTLTNVPDDNRKIQEANAKAAEAAREAKSKAAQEAREANAKVAQEAALALKLEKDRARVVQLASSLPGLQRLVEDFNDLLIKAQEASHNFDATSAAEAASIKLLAKAPPEYVTQWEKDADDLHKELMLMWDDEPKWLRKAIILHAIIIAAPHFDELYHETRVCLPPEQIVVDKAEDMVAARNLRFIEKR